MDDVRLRDALRPEDRPAIEVILRYSGVFREEEIVVGLELFDETLAPRLDTDYEWVVAEVGESIAGFACYGPVPMTVGTYDLYWIAVAPEARGTAVATLLDEAVESRTKAKDGRWLLAETSSTAPFEAARRFYARRGYALLERLPDYYRDGDDRLTFGKRLR